MTAPPVLLAALVVAGWLAASAVLTLGLGRTIRLRDAHGPRRSARHRP